ncbi:hypothetical protein N9L92_02365 [Saprospiraceae bacterium]|nr:hypothetical protein [Saprospiraceae bacterium]
MKYLSLSIIILLLTVISCRPKHDNPEVKKLYDEVIEIHDEVMPKISDISKLRRKVRKKEDQNSTTLALIKQLEDADDGMMSWMSDFQTYKSYSDSTKESKMKYLKMEKMKIQNVSDEMYSAINSAKEFLDEK